MDGNFDLPEILRSAGTAAQIGRESGLWSGLKRRFTRAPGIERDYQAEMLEVLRDNALDTAGSLDLTAEQAIRILSPDFDVTDLQAPDPTWQKHWLTGASKVAADDQERQKWWARLLAGELKRPGSYPLRSIATMDVLSWDEAELFTRFAPYFWDVTNGSHPVLLPREGSSLWMPRWDQMVTLQEAGLATAMGLPNRITVNPGQRLEIRQNGKALHLLVNKAGDILETNLLLTQTGREILTLARPEEVPGYLEEVITQLQTHCMVSQITKT